MQEIIDFSNEFNKFAKENSLALVELEQANFIAASKNVLNLENIVKNIISSTFYNLYKGVVFSDLDLFIDRILISQFSLIDKKHMMLLLIASRSEKYAQTLAGNLKEDERKFLNSYLKKTKEFVNYVLDKNNKDEIALFLYDLNAFRKYIKKDEFLMPMKITQAFNWVKKIEEKDVLKELEKTNQALFLSRRKYYDKLDLYKDLVKDYKNYEKRLNILIKDIQNKF
ncbi:hypothetical protein AVANS_0331 [Campylobacter sp. RM5004]|uniref:hypothetical protein n=1 Tax=Campylobacter sp. RM5004 TaxID=1660078 RepID=UPI001EFA9E51|nr:hypothetical protein [Campylobacter sp. RM5004]ULO00972.1 hypothetical protein AVANS_0331 [Campylobacter sp. RM5004]